MAITINSTPVTYATLNEPLWFVVTSTNIAQPNFKYVFEVYINSVRVATIKLFQDVATGKGIFNAASVVRSYMASYFKPSVTQTAFTYTGNDIYVSYEIRYGEEYGGTTYLNLTSATYKAYNFYHPTLRTYGTDYFSNYTNKFITNRDFNTLECEYTDRLYLSWFMPSATAISMTIGKLFENGTPDGISYTGGSITKQQFTLLDISPAAINNYLAFSHILDTTYKYFIRINYASASSNVYVKLVCNPKYTKQTLHFLNELGGYDSFSFRLLSRQNRTFEKKSLEKFNYELSGTSMVQIDGYNVVKGGAMNYSNRQSVSFTLNSDWVNEQDYNWLRELISSNEVYLENNGQFHPVIIKQQNWVSKNTIIDKMFNLQLEVEVSNKINSQYR